MNHIALRQNPYGGYGNEYGYDDEEPVEDFVDEPEMMMMEAGEDMNDADMTIE